MVRFHVKYSYYSLKKKELTESSSAENITWHPLSAFYSRYIQSSWQGTVLIKNMMMIFIECLPYEQL